MKYIKTAAISRILIKLIIPAVIFLFSCESRKIYQFIPENTGSIKATLSYEKTNYYNSSITSYRIVANFDSLNQNIDAGDVYLNNVKLTKVKNYPDVNYYILSSIIPFEPNKSYTWKIEGNESVKPFTIEITSPILDIEINSPPQESIHYSDNSLQITWNEPPWSNSHIELNLFDEANNYLLAYASDDGVITVPSENLSDMVAGRLLIVLKRFTYMNIYWDTLHPDSYCEMKTTAQKVITLRHPGS